MLANLSKRYFCPVLALAICAQIEACSTAHYPSGQFDVSYAKYFDVRCEQTLDEICVESSVAKYLDIVPELIAYARQKSNGDYPIVGVRYEKDRSKHYGSTVLAVVSGQYQYSGNAACCGYEDVYYFAVNGQSWSFLESAGIFYDPG